MSLWWLLVIVPASMFFGIVVGAACFSVLIGHAFKDVWK